MEMPAAVFTRDSVHIVMMLHVANLSVVTTDFVVKVAGIPYVPRWQPFRANRLEKEFAAQYQLH